jgi:dsRNA-specific ribonuclease
MAMPTQGSRSSSSSSGNVSMASAGQPQPTRSPAAAAAATLGGWWALLERPSTLAAASIPYALPPKWATGLHTALTAAFPGHVDRPGTRPVFYLKAFVHPSFVSVSSEQDEATDAADAAAAAQEQDQTTASRRQRQRRQAAEAATMRHLAPVGQRVLDFAAGSWITQSMAGLTGAQLAALVADVTSDATLHRLVLCDAWRLETFVLTDRLVEVVRKHGTGAGGLRKWSAVVERQATGDGDAAVVGVSMPDAFGAEAVRALVGSVYADHGLEASVAFCGAHVLPYCALGRS